jgi:hypothetical protein
MLVRMIRCSQAERVEATDLATARYLADMNRYMHLARATSDKQIGPAGPISSLNEFRRDYLAGGPSDRARRARHGEARRRQGRPPLPTARPDSSSGLRLDPGVFLR